MGETDFLDIDKMEVEGKRVLVRVGMDISVDREGNIIDDKRIVACIPTIQHLVDRKAKVILSLHIGRPDGKVVEHLKTDNVARRLSRFIYRPIKKLDSVVGEDVKKEVERMNPGDIIFLENVRFHEGERNNSEDLARELSSLADVYVNECFSVSHRKHASMVGVPKYIPGCGGFGLRKEIDTIKSVLKSPERPFVAIIGGIKADKFGALKKLTEKADRILIGGGLAFLLLKMKGYGIGDSKFDEEWLNGALKGDMESVISNKKIILPKDLLVAREFSVDAECKVVQSNEIEEGWMGLDIGPETLKEYKEILSKAKTIVWAGPMGVFEWKRFAAGTRELAELIAGLDAISVIGGGETASAMEMFNYTDRMTHVSTGGGAFLDFIANESLPAVDALIESRIRFE